MSNTKQENFRKKLLFFLRDYGLMISGSFLFTLAVDMFNAPNNIVAGGVTGISTILNSLFALPIGTMNIIINNAWYVLYFHWIIPAFLNSL